MSRAAYRAAPGAELQDDAVHDERGSRNRETDDEVERTAEPKKKPSSPAAETSPAAVADVIIMHVYVHK